MQMEKQRQEIAEKQKVIKDLEITTDSLDSKDPKHVSKLSRFVSRKLGMQLEISHSLPWSLILCAPD